MQRKLCEIAFTLDFLIENIFVRQENDTFLHRYLSASLIHIRQTAHTFNYCRGCHKLYITTIKITIKQGVIAS